MDDERDRERRDELPEHETRPEDAVQAPSTDEPLPGEETPADEEPAIDPDAPPPAYRFR